MPHPSPDALPRWYVAFARLYRPAWWGGTALIVGSWFHIVSPTVGWVGFGIAAAAAAGAAVLPALAGVKSGDHVALDSRLVKAKDGAYRDALERFRNGASLTHDGVTFALRPDDVVACAVVADATNFDDAEAAGAVGHATAVFDRLVDDSAEFATAVAGRTPRVSVMSGTDPHARELRRVVDGRAVPQS